MSKDGAPAIGSSIVLSLDGQKVTGKVTAVQADKLVVRLTILQPAKAYAGVQALSILPNGQEVSFDLGNAAYYSELLIEVPLPVGMRVTATPRPPAVSKGLALPGTPVSGTGDTPVAKASPREIVRPAESQAVVRPGEPSAAAKRLEEALAKPALNKLAAEDDEPPRAEPVAPRPPAKPPGDERRHFFRFAVDCPVEVIENVGQSREYVRESGHTLNLSGGGMLAEFDKPLVPGLYRFRLHLPEEVMHLTGRVIKKETESKRIVPIEFADLHESERSRLIRFIFNMMRNLRNAARGLPLEPATEKEEKKDDKPREKAYAKRREKYFSPNKIRYW